MRLRIAKVALIVGIILAGACIALVAIGLTKQQNTPRVVDQSSQIKSKQNTAAALPAAYVPGLPMRILIPKINVNAPIDSLGLTVEGDLDAPKDIANAGWYNAGPRAGSPGSAVMDGHFGGSKTKPAVFDNLHTLVKGDRIQVVDTDERIHTFIVSTTRTFQPEEDASDVFRSSDNKSHLNLITCQGQWVASKESYTTRLVVFADLLEE